MIVELGNKLCVFPETCRSIRKEVHAEVFALSGNVELVEQVVHDGFALHHDRKRKKKLGLI